MIVGAYNAQEAAGRVALIAEIPDGYHRLWDIADASVVGRTPGQKVGSHVDAGDLDGDGHTDLVAAAPIGNTTYVLRGPFSGDRSVEEAEWTIHGTEALQWAGYGTAISDLTGDGAPRPRHRRPLLDLPERRAPRHCVAVVWPCSRRLHYRRSPPDPHQRRHGQDAFGIEVVTGDIDGDGLGDLAIGAPYDATAGRDAGSVTIVFGASL